MLRILENADFLLIYSFDIEANLHVMYPGNYPVKGVIL
jgi:hypothetical protein